MYKKILFKYKERMIFRKILLSVFLISTFFVVLVCVLIFHSLSTESQRDIKQAQQQAITNYNTIIDSYISSAETSAISLYQNVYVKRIIVRNQLEWNDNMSVVANSILNTVKVNPLFHSVYVYGTEGILVKSTNYSHVTNADVDALMEEAFRASYKKINNTWSYEDIQGEEHHILSVSIGEGNEKKAIFEEGVSINIDISEMFRSVFPQMKERESYLLIDGQGNVLEEKGDMFVFGEQTSDFLKLQSMISGNAVKSMVMSTKGDKYLLIGTGSSYHDYYLIHMLPYEYVTGSMAKVVFSAALCGAAMLVVSLGVSLLISYRLYHPVDEVVDNLQEARIAGGFYEEEKAGANELSMVSGTISAMVESLNQYRRVSTSDQMVNFLCGRHNYKDIPKGFLEYIAESFSGYCYFAQVICICDKERFIQENTESAIQFQLETVCGIIETQYEDTISPIAYILDHEYIVAFLFAPKDTTLEYIKKTSDDLIKRIRQLVSLEVNIGVSQKEVHIEELKMRFKAAKSATNYRFIYGKNAVITEPQMQACAFYNETDFDLQSFDKVIRGMEEEKFIEVYDKLEQYIRKNALQTGYDLLLEVAYKMLLYYSEITISRNMNNPNNYEQLREEIWGFSYLEDARKWFLLYYKKICDVKNQALQTGTADIVKSGVRYIHEHYSNINLNAQYIAGILNITPSYFSRIFNDYMQCPFPDYLANVRLEAGRKLLLEKQDMNIQQISESVGYMNLSYFIALFKKKYGVPPGKYRLNNFMETGDNEV